MGNSEYNLCGWYFHTTFVNTSVNKGMVPNSTELATIVGSFEDLLANLFPIGWVTFFIFWSYWHNLTFFGFILRACALVCAVAREGNFAETVCGRGFWFGFLGNPTAVLLYRLSFPFIDGIYEVVVRAQRAVQAGFFEVTGGNAALFHSDTVREHGDDLGTCSAG